LRAGGFGQGWGHDSDAQLHGAGAAGLRIFSAANERESEGGDQDGSINKMSIHDDILLKSLLLVSQLSDHENMEAPSVAPVRHERGCGIFQNAPSFCLVIQKPKLHELCIMRRLNNPELTSAIKLKNFC
jgi:hypothetical protein